MAVRQAAFDGLVRTARLRQEVRAVWMYGSHARGTSDADSDADALVVAAPGAPGLRALRGELRRDAGVPGIQMTVMTEDRLREVTGAGTTFATHLMHEAVALWDPSDLLARLSPRFRPRREGLTADLERLRRGFAPYRSLSAFNRHYELLFGDCYALARSAAMTLLVADGRPAFDRRVLFARLAESRPNLAQPARRIERLQPYYLMTRRGRDAEAPVAADDAVAAREAVDACASILGAQA
jgi:predicted nucleotidyltransferase